jgi:ATP-binding cassette, subfamily B (MDR/TAP), member 1
MTFKLFPGMVIGMAVGLTYNWKLGLVCCVFFPFSVLAVYLESRLSSSQNGRQAVLLESAGRLAAEAVTNIRTVAGLGCEAAIVQRFTACLAASGDQFWRAAHKRGGLFGYSQAAQYFGWGLTAYYGGVLVVEECMAYQYVYLITNAIIGSAAMIGHTFAFTADFNRAVAAAGRVFHLLDRRPQIEASTTAGLLLNSPITGRVELDKVEFSYPTR